jgi:hypothetical protein
MALVKKTLSCRADKALLVVETAERNGPLNAIPYADVS